MPLISAEIMKTIGERALQKTTKKQRQKGAKETEPIAKGWELHGFVMHTS